MTSRRPGPARALATTAALVLALALGACSSSDDDSDDGATTGSPAPTSGLPTTEPTADETTTDETTAEPTETPTSAAVPEEPSSVEAVAASKDWVAALDELVDPSVPAKRRVAHIQGGADLITAVPQLDRAIAGIPLTFSVTGPEVDGNEGSGQVTLTSAGEDFGSVRDVTFARVDGEWRLTRAGVCQMASVAGLTCP